jgi:circadian clock protein KaiB
VSSPEDRPETASGHEQEPSFANDMVVLRLYVTGMTPRSSRAVANLRLLCETHLPDRYDLQVIDLYQQPASAKDEQILAAPTLIKKRPLPQRRMIGDMSDETRVLAGIGVPARAEGPAHD